MKWLKAHGLWAGFNLTGVVIAGFTLTQGSTNWNTVDAFDPGLASGKWAIRFLLFSLAITPMRTYLGWKRIVRLRKSSGLWSLGFAIVHTAVYLYEIDWKFWNTPWEIFIGLGLVGLVILGALGVTSNRRAMKRMKKNWKRLHRTVYLAGGAIVLHPLLAAPFSKKMSVRDPNALPELQVYAAVMAALLALRIPTFLRGFVTQVRIRAQAQPMQEPLDIMVAIPAPDPLDLPTQSGPSGKNGREPALPQASLWPAGRTDAQSRRSSPSKPH